jgi:hypothetical protein
VPIVYVDANAPAHVAADLAQRADDAAFTLIRRDQFMPANKARNLGLALVRTRYAAIMDNDVFLRPGWLPTLVRAAEETGAWAVGPVVCKGGPDSDVIHWAGTSAGITDANGRRNHWEDTPYLFERLADVAPRLALAPVDQIEFHCVLVRTDLFDRIGPLDEGLLSWFDHSDLSLRIREAGGTLFVEPRAAVTYVPPPPVRPSDLGLLLLRWSKAWYEASAARFAARWGLEPAGPGFAPHAAYRRQHRSTLLTRYRRVNDVVERTVGTLMERAVVPRLWPGPSLPAAG